MSALAAVVMIMGATGPTKATTDFGVRAVGGAIVAHSSKVYSGAGEPFRIDRVALLAARWGRVTSTLRSPEHNRRVGGVANSYHLRGHAIDIARSPGVTHAMIEAELRQQNYHLIESLDEGDHSHFAFASPTRSVQVARAKALNQDKGTLTSGTAWRIIAAPR
jgi:hypothetical protein